MVLMASMAIVSVPIVRSDPVRGPAVLGLAALFIMTICIVGLVIFHHSEPSDSLGPSRYEGAASPPDHCHDRPTPVAVRAIGSSLRSS
jgi:hypothetical protein